MKMRTLISRSVAFFSVLLLSATTLPNCVGQIIVEDTNIQLFDIGPFPDYPEGVVRQSGTFQLSISQTASLSPSDPTGVFFRVDVLPPLPVFPNPPSLVALEGRDVALDEGADLYFAPADELFSLNTIDSGNFQPLVEGTSFSSASFPLDDGESTDFFLAIATTETDFGPFVEGADRDVFGWARFNFDADNFELTLLDSAVAYGTGNIIIGQNAAAVPEPSSGTAALVLLGQTAARRRKR